MRLFFLPTHKFTQKILHYPNTAPPLVLTQSDFLRSIVRNEPFLEELKRLAYDCSIVFVGFEAQRKENNHILANIIETYRIIASSFHQSFQAFTILKDVDEVTKGDIEDAGLTLIQGTFEEFIDTASTIAISSSSERLRKDISRQLWVKAAGQEIPMTLAQHKQYNSQFSCYYEGYLQDAAEEIKAWPSEKIVDLWKTMANDSLLAAGYYIERTALRCMKDSLDEIIQKVSKRRMPQIFVIWGKRASGKSIFARQLLRYAYEELHQPVLSLSRDASDIRISHINKQEIMVSGWDVTLIDKFLANFFDSDTSDAKSSVPVLLADHLSQRIVALDHIVSYLENHGKSGVLILTLNDDEFESLRGPSAGHTLLQHYDYSTYEVPHKMDDEEITALFNVVGRLNTRVYDQSDLLLNRAKNKEECSRDILLIIYTWFDAKFRRLDEIIAEQISELSTKETLKSLYLAIAVFHQYNFSPKISLCAEALGVSIDDFIILRREPAFKSFIEVINSTGNGGTEMVATRHAEFSRRILQQLVPENSGQVELMCKVLSKCKKKDYEFVRAFLIYIFRFSMLSVSQVTQIKEATEIHLNSDSFLNHQFGAYLIRERTELDHARYYLDIALQEDPDNSAIIHSLGNLCYKKYKEAIETDEKQAMQYFMDARLYFEKARTLEVIREEHAYFTDIDMTRDAATKVSALDKRLIMKCEQHALTFEALRVVPVERQILLREKLGEALPFQDLSDAEKSAIRSEVLHGKVSALILEYYTNSLIVGQKRKNWNRLKEIICCYWDRAKSEPSMAVVLCRIAKYAFIFNANTRFELLRMHFDTLVRYRDKKINFWLLAEYVRLIQVDAFVLEKYDFLHSIAGDVVELYRHSKPRFQMDEYILENKYYNFNEEDKDNSINVNIFTEKPDFGSINKARRFNKSVDIDRGRGEKYFHIKMDPFSKYFVLALRKETALTGRVEVNFAIKHTYQGIMATGFQA